MTIFSIEFPLEVFVSDPEIKDFIKCFYKWTAIDIDLPKDER
jgi:hypothetical protein